MTHVGLVRKVLSNLLVDRLQTLAVATPWSRESDDNIFVRVEGNVVEGVNVKNLICRRGRGLDVRLYARFCRDATK